jgi:PAS domain S-box-containing protein
MAEENLPQDPFSLLSAIFDSSDDAIISKNLDGIITSWNRAAERIFGYTAEEAVGQPISILFPPDRLDEEPKILERLRRGERIDHFETIRQTKEGKLLNISVTISPVKDTQGRIVGASKIARDITPQVDLRTELRRSEERFGITLSSIGDAVIATDQKGHITYMNAVAEELTGWSGLEATGLPLPKIFNIINEYSRESVTNPVVKVLETGGIVGLANNTILVAKDGTERPIDDSGAPIREPNGEINGVVLVFRDVTERRAAEVASLRLAAIVHGSDDAIIGKDLSGIITNWNTGAERIFGYSHDEIVGKSILTLIPPDLQDEEKSILARLHRGERIEHFETTRLTKEGKPLQISVSVSPVKDAEGRIIGASKIARDVTERKQMEQALVDARNQLELHAAELEQRVEERTKLLQKTIGELEAFSFSLSHDMRAPLRAIQSFLQIFLEDYGASVDPEGHAVLQKVVSSAKRMDRMVLDLLTFTRLSHEPVVIEPVDVEKVVQDVIRDRPEFDSSHSEILVRSPLHHVMGNTASLTQCLNNLLTNAVKFVAPGVRPNVYIYSEETDGRVRLFVQDNGIGIPSQDQVKLFGMFQRLQGDKYPGTGIGLAIIRKAVERMNGTVGLESEPSQGTRFWLELPAVTA